jgi:endonuclease IV
MEIIVSELVKLVWTAKRVRLQPSKDSLEYRETQGRQAFENLLPPGPKWINDVLSKKGNRYVGAQGSYYFIYSSKLHSVKQRSQEAYTLFNGVAEDFLSDFTPSSSLKIILWLQKEVLSLDMTDQMYRALKDGTNVTLNDYNLLKLYMDKIGDTREINAISATETPVQVFLTEKEGQSLYSRDIQSSMLKHISKYILLGKKVYVHASFRYNLCDSSANATIVRLEIEESTRVGVKAIVLHVGKNVGDTMNSIKAISVMKHNVSKLLQLVDKKCPLLIETPAGQGGEILTSIEEMISFYNLFTSEEKEKLGICVDTAHVWACGYNPESYLITLRDKLGPVVKLIHFNDAKYPCFCQIDRHFAVGGGMDTINKIVETKQVPPMKYAGELGYIGVKRMIAVAEWAYINDVDCVREY